MKNLLKSLILAAMIVPSLVFAQEIDVVLIGGQSNCVGQGYVRNLPRCFEIDTTVKLYYSKFCNFGEGSNVWGALRAASEAKDKFGVELGLGNALQGKLPTKKLALIKHAQSGSNIHTQWNPGNRENEKMGAEYLKFLTTVKDGLAKLEADGYKPIIRGMVWQQGEADARFDAGIENSKRYAENLCNFINHVRKEFNCPDMPFIYGEVMPMAAERFSARDMIRAAQVEVSEGSGSKFSVKNAVLVEGDDLQMRRTDYKTPLPNDDVHLGTYGLLTLGERFAKEILKKVYGEDKK